MFLYIRVESQGRQGPCHKGLNNKYLNMYISYLLKLKTSLIKIQIKAIL